jgi:hypothetical protein
VEIAEKQKTKIDNQPPIDTKSTQLPPMTLPQIVPQKSDCGNAEHKEKGPVEAGRSGIIDPRRLQTARDTDPIALPHLWYQEADR